MYKTRATYIKHRIKDGTWDVRTKTGKSIKGRGKTRYAIRKKLLKKSKHLSVGSKFRGKVIRILDYGAIIDITGFSCFLHISEISNEWVNHPSNFLSLYKLVDVWIVSRIVDNRGRLSINLTMKGPPSPELIKKYWLRQKKW